MLLRCVPYTTAWLLGSSLGSTENALLHGWTGVLTHIFGGKRQGMLKTLGGRVDRDPCEVLCALYCLSESALFPITCREVNADSTVPGLDSLPGKRRSLPAGFHEAFSVWCFKPQMLEACDIPSNSASVL